MNLPAFCVRRPVLTAMLTLIVGVLGGMSLANLRTDLLPEIEMPWVTVRVNWSGAAPEVVESQVTDAVEELVKSAPGIEWMSSESGRGRSQVRLRFSPSVGIDEAADSVKARLDEGANRFPDEATRPRVDTWDVNASPVVLIGVSGPMNLLELSDLAIETLKDRLVRVPGVADAEIWGDTAREVNVDLDPAKVKALQLPLDGLLQTIRDANVDLPAGELDEGKATVGLRAPAGFKSIDELRRLVVATPGDDATSGVVTLGEIAEVDFQPRRRDRGIRIDGDTGVRIAINKQADANTVDVADAVLAELEELRADFPQLRFVPLSDQGGFIDRSIDNVARSVLYGGSLAVLVLLVFLRSVRSTLVIAIAIPIAIVATFALMNGGGLTLNLMTLGGLALGVGMMVDSSIVVIENIARRRDEEREDGKTAAIRGAAEVGPAILASTVTTLVIFLPLVFVDGSAGTMFRQLGYVVAFSLLASLVVSLTLVPVLASQFLARRGRGGAGGASAADAAGDPHATPPRSGFRRIVDRGSSAIGGGLHRMGLAYGRLLRRVLRFRGLTVAAAFSLLGLSLLLFPLIGTELLPPTDEGRVQAGVNFASGTTLELTDRQSRLLEELVDEALPGIPAKMVETSPGRARIEMKLPPASERELSNQEVAQELRRVIRGTVPGGDVWANGPQGDWLLQRLLGGGNASRLEVKIRGSDLDELRRLTLAAEEVVQGVDGVTWVNVPDGVGTPEKQLVINRDKAADLGLEVVDLARTVELAVAGRQAGDFRRGGDSYPIRVRLADARSLPVEELLDLQVTVAGAGSDRVPLRSVLDVVDGLAPEEIDHEEGRRVSTIRANTSGRDLGSIAADIEAGLATIARPPGYELGVAGSLEEQKKAFRELLVSIVLSLVLVYMVLASQYESLRDPVVVMLAVPVAAVGVLVTLYLTSTTLNLQSYIGCIMLGGIVVNNAILLVDQARQLRAGEGGEAPLGTDAAVIEAGRRRLRPILMTTLTTVLGLFPLALGIGEGADAQAPLARAVLGGLIASTLITLVLIPAVYSLVHRGADPRTAGQNRPFAPRSAAVAA
ncbi:efflux RND transporter permease subunit [Phycisphaera mikurensis]|uniref:Putative efflux system inner membrane protein n=1 Tax=Phycisphaera mikurensis (strain NBRC 102666 / KCTC 22515 / FYK2301M01) TaxID=1142394 RepID=I0IEG0_PHYMF|nr:efflux RND transporter permease subunit [Phycisphaera mikurensis]MBB6441447.1 HAE1 family hydrophobic/amphiphilic exporter-1 [Phycisphaera mikurensis]BAM03648.1 putative efflux system inner membrane protein [Phycisphaera mikurensis NBRC 102666]